MKSWTHDGDLAAWMFESDQPSLSAGLIEAVDLLGDFAHPGRCRVSSHAQGEDAAIAPATPDGIAAALDRVPDVSEVEIDLSLSIDDGAGDRLEDGAGLLWAYIDDDGRGPLRLRLSIDIDIYAEQTWGKQRDNRQLAARNAPRLRRFIHRLGAAGWRCVDVDAPHYPGQVDAGGFRTTCAE